MGTSPVSPHSINWGQVNWGKILAITGILLNVGSAIGYCLVKDYRRATYYAAAAILTTTVVF